jgi:hypothetical protein
MVNGSAAIGEVRLKGVVAVVNQVVEASGEGRLGTKESYLCSAEGCEDGAGGCQGNLVYAPALS